MEQEKPFTPSEAFKHFFESVSFTDILWIVITFFFGYIMYIVAKRQYERNRYTLADVVTWFLAAGLTAVLTYSVLSFSISLDGAFAWSIYIICLLIAFLVVYSAYNNLLKFQKLINSLILCVIGICLFWSFIAGRTGLSYAIMTGVFQGASLQLFISTLSKYINILRNTGSNSDNNEDEFQEGQGKI